MSAGGQRRLERALEILLGRRKPKGRAERTRLSKARSAHLGWLQDPGLTGIGIGHRETDGKQLPELAIRVHVAEKRTADRVAKHLIPPAIRLPGIAGAIPIDVVNSGVIRAQAAVCGDAIACERSVSWGTLGCLVNSTAVRLSGKTFALTCGHVLDQPEGTAVDWLGFPGGGDNNRVRLGHIAVRSTPAPSSQDDVYPNLYDMALAEVEQLSVDDSQRAAGHANGFRTTPLQMGEPVSLSGAATGRVSGQVKEVSINKLVKLGGQLCGFYGLVLHNAPTAPGDSGAAVMDSQDRIVGLHLGVIENGLAAMIPIGPIVRRYGIRLLERFPTAADAGKSVMTDDRAVAIDTLARTIWGEARGEIQAGREAVANVVVNRVRRRRPGWGLTIESVCRKPRQFSCWNPEDPNRRKLGLIDCSDTVFSDCLETARQAANGTLPDRTFGSCHYHALAIVPSWAEGHRPIVVIGSHAFYNDIP